jgi:hypothetical protein
MNTSLVPMGVRQGNEKKPDKKQPAGEDSNLGALDEYLRNQTMTGKEEKVSGHVYPQPTYRDKDVNNTDSKLGDYSSTVKQQFNLNSDITQAMAANTIQNKKELWRIEQLNQSSAQLGTQFGLAEAAKRQHKKGGKVHRLSQQTSWI